MPGPEIGFLITDIRPLGIAQTARREIETERGRRNELLQCGHRSIQPRVRILLNDLYYTGSTDGLNSSSSFD
eukprot:3040921-Pleurochrysis_carterae.AAC.1